MLYANLTHNSASVPGPSLVVKVDVQAALRLLGLRLAAQVAYVADQGAFRAVYYEPRDARWFGQNLNLATAWAEVQDPGRDPLNVHDPRLMVDRRGARWAATLDQGGRFTSDYLSWEAIECIITERNKPRRNTIPAGQAPALTPADDTEITREED